jgi:hypothetical protein
MGQIALWKPFQFFLLGISHSVIHFSVFIYFLNSFAKHLLPNRSQAVLAVIKLNKTSNVKSLL